ncbi:hypothetical protein BpHYR1_047985 [Brachionus plicatilis]|uniref:CUB domain-containing protein n=1 Tax=Brachionus plicatilis TaxID=10195 RepID=A0A3M7R5E0_BRAPC|nr:hypothetical protein BpHYR1_047985 [Brachionus plicatilis]
MRLKFLLILLVTALSAQDIAELLDDYLDPADLAEYRLSQLKEEQLSDTTTESSTTEQTTEFAEPEQYDTGTEPIEFDNTTLADNGTSQVLVESTTTVTTTTTKDLPKQGEINLVIKSGEYEEILVQRSDDKSHTQTISIASSNKNYQVELKIVTESRHLDFSQCAMSQKSDCLKSYIEILDSNSVLKVKRYLLPFDVKLRLRQIVSGCDSISRMRDIDMEGDLPNIYHNSDHDCIYRIKNTDLIRSMVSLKVVSFPIHEDRICHASMHVTTANNLENKNDYFTQAVFESAQSLDQFENGVLVGSRFVLVKLINCFENNEPIEVNVGKVRRSVKEIRMTETENKYYHRLDSALITSPKLDSYLQFELENKDPRNKIAFKLTEYKTKTLCNSEKNSSLITVYGLNQFDQMYVKQFTPCKFDNRIYELRGFRKLYVQLSREPHHPSVNPVPDNFVMEFNLKVIKSYINCRLHKL